MTRQAGFRFTASPAIHMRRHEYEYEQAFRGE